MVNQLQKIREAYAVRLRTLDTAHPIIRRLPEAWQPTTLVPAPPLVDPPLPPCRQKNPPKPPTRLLEIAQKIDPQTENIIPFLTPPWRRTRHDEDIKSRFILTRATGGVTKTEAARRHCEHISTFEMDPTHLLVYTDGSQLMDKDSGARLTGAGAIIIYAGDKINEISAGMGDTAEVYDAELLGLALGANRAVQIAIASEADTIPTIRHIHFYVDNDAAAGRVSDDSNSVGQGMATNFWDIVLYFLEADPLNTIEISWIPGHQDIKWNEVVDEVAKEATKRPSHFIPTLTNARRQGRASVNAVVRAQWDDDRGKNELFEEADHIPPKTQPPTHFTLLPRRLYALVLQCRTGHSFTGEYYNRFVPSEDPKCPCEATSLETRDHILSFCQRYEEARGILQEASKYLEPKVLLGTEKGIMALAEFIRATGAFTKKGQESARMSQELVME